MFNIVYFLHVCTVYLSVDLQFCDHCCLCNIFFNVTYIHAIMPSYVFNFYTNKHTRLLAYCIVHNANCKNVRK
jgi:hypothetical protein